MAMDEMNGEENVVGALANAFRGPQRSGFRLPAAAHLPASAAANAQTAKIRAYCGLGTVSWTGTDDADKTMEVEPQSTFQGERLVITARYSDGAVARLVTINRPLTIGGLPQTPAPEQEAPIEMFAADVTYSLLTLKPATAGTKISLGLRIDDAPGTGESVVVAAGMFGQWIQ